MSRVRNSRVIAAIAAVSLTHGLGATLWAGTASASLTVTANVQAKAVIISIGSPSFANYDPQGDARFLVTIRAPKGLPYRTRFLAERSMTKGPFRLASLRTTANLTDGIPSSAAMLAALNESDSSAVALMIEW